MSLKKIFSINNTYMYDARGIISKIYKEIIILGIKIKISKNFSKLEKDFSSQIITLNEKVNNLEYFLSYLSLDNNVVYSYNTEIEKILCSNTPEDKLLVTNLFSNLNEDAVKNLSEILDRNRRIINHINIMKRRPKAIEVYTTEEMEDYNKLLEFEKNIVVHKDYFSYNNFKLPVNFFEASVFLYKHGIDCLKNKNIDKNKAIIDVGANIGDSMLVFRDNFVDNPIIAFEPETQNYEFCLKTIELNNLKNIKVENIGLGDISKIAYINPIGSANLSSQINDTQGDRIKVQTFDEYVKENNIEVGLIKVDIEGFEPKFIKGAQETIKEQAPILLLSIYHNTSDFFNIKPMIEKIMENSRYKYEFNFFNPVYKWTIGETLLICEPTEKD